MIGASVYLRLAAAVGIVWFHTPRAPGKPIAGAGLPIFIMLSFMSVRRPTALPKYLTRRSQRILLPLAAWWAFYAAVDLYLRRGRLTGITSSGSIWELLGWPAVPLWYLPFLFINSVALQVVRPLFRMLPAGLKMMAGLTAGVGAQVLQSKIEGLRLPRVVGLWVLCLPVVGFAVALGYAIRADRSRRWIGVGLIIALVVSLIVCIGPANALSYGLGVALMGLCAVPIPRTRLATKLASLTFGIYLMHPFAFLVVHKLAGADAHFGWFLVAGVFGAGLGTWLMKQAPVLRGLV